MPCNRNESIAARVSSHDRWVRHVAVKAWLALVASLSCTDSSGPGVGTVPAQIKLVSEIAPTGYRGGAVVYPPLVLQVTDEAGRPVPSTQLVFSGDGEVEPNPASTDEEGKALVSWRLGYGVRTHSVVVSVPGAGSVSPLTISTTTIPSVISEIWVLPTGATLDQGASFRVRTAAWQGSEIIEEFPLTWASSNASVASVSPTGVVTGLSPGLTTITATYQHDRPGGWGVRRLSASTFMAVPVPPGPGGPGIPAFTMAVTRGFGSWVTIVRSDGTIEATIACGGQCYHLDRPNWSRDGRQLAMTGQRDTMSVLFVANRDGTDLHEVASAPRFVVRTDRFTFTYYPEFFEDWSADGRLVYIRTTRSGQSIETVGADGTGRSVVTTTSQPLETPFGGMVGEPRWGPGDTVITAAISGQLHAIEPDGTNLRPLIASDAPRSFSHEWSPDGRGIAWRFYGAGDIEGAAILDPRSGSLREVILPAGHVSQMCWSPASSKLSFFHTSGLLHEAWGSIYTMNVDGSGLRRVVTPISGEFIGWSPDEGFLVHTDRRFYTGALHGQLYAQSLAAGTNTRLADLDSVEFGAIAGTRGCRL